jgi:hypothetical protein
MAAQNGWTEEKKKNKCREDSDCGQNGQESESVKPLRNRRRLVNNHHDQLARETCGNGTFQVRVANGSTHTLRGDCLGVLPAPEKALLLDLRHP